ncbi:MAG: hypothetical protein OER04_18670 [Cyclobacteriaceae bacterium]|nr:hypothetical protein [Cyclobacteriaceae bacterium]
MYGDGVNLASRVESIGISGGILISDKVNYAIKNHSGIQTQSLGHFEFKNIIEPVEIFTITNSGIKIPNGSELKGKLKGTKKSIAVLPFENMSPDPENEYFSDGIAGEILNALVKVEGLQVIARTSSFVFKGKNVDVREIGRLLNVEHILEGSVRKAGKRVRITAQLVSALDGIHLFSESYDRSLEDIFAVQDEIAQKITNRLRKHLGETEHRELLVTAPTENFEAYEKYLQGVFHLNQWGDEAALNAMPYFYEAIEMQNDFSQAHAHLATCYLFQAFGGKMSWPDAHQHAIIHINRALELDSDDLEALYALTAFQSFLEWDWVGLKKTVDKIINLNPGKVNCYHAIATYHCILGDIEAAIKAEKKGLQLDPLSVQSNLYLGVYHAWSAQLDEAIRYLDKVLELDPKHRTATEFKGWVFLYKEQYQLAEQWFQKIEPAMGYRLHRSTCLGYLYTKTNRMDKAKTCLREIEQLDATAIGHTFSIDLAILHAGFGNSNEVFTYLEKAIKTKIGDTSMFYGAPVFNSYKSDARFQKLLDLVGTGLRVDKLQVEKIQPP